MKYIVHHDFNSKAICGDVLNLPAGTEVQCNDKMISTMDGRDICLISSENGKKYFCRDDDGQGMERGKITYNIAYGARERLSANGSTYRFSDEEADMLFNDYSHWLRKRSVILFNDDFFAAEVDDLKELADKLGIA